MPEQPFDLSRREFMYAGTTSLVALQSGGLQQIENPENPESEYAFGGVADLMGPQDARPMPGDGFFDNKQFYAYRYEATDTGARYFITQDDTQWSELMAYPETQVDEVRTQRFQSFLNHTFARPNAPDDKNWDYTAADITKQNSEVELAATTLLESNQRGNYAPGSESVPGVAWRTTATPTAGRGDAGYFDANNGFGVGEDATDSYVFLRKGGTEHRVYRGDWNQYTPGSRVWTGSTPVITRFPHLFYGGGAIGVRAIVHDGGETDLRTLHQFTPDSIPNTLGDGPPFNQPNLPVAFESDGLSGASLRANAAHYELGDSEAENRVNGEHFGPITAGTTGWTPLLIWQKRAGWEMVNVKPLKFTVSASTNNARLGLQLNPSLSSVTTSLPTNSSSDETAVEIVDATFDAPGERRWAGFATAGQGNSSGSSDSQALTFNLPVDQPVALVAQGVGGDATLSGAVDWEEYF